MPYYLKDPNRDHNFDNYPCKSLRLVGVARPNTQVPEAKGIEPPVPPARATSCHSLRSAVLWRLFFLEPPNLPKVLNERIYSKT